MEMRKRIAIIILAISLAAIACGDGGGGGGGGGGTDLSDPKYDMYYECTARQRDGGYGYVEAAARCAKLKP